MNSDKISSDLGPGRSTELSYRSQSNPDEMNSDLSKQLEGYFTN